jgi:Acyl-CoA dehydrogenases
VVSPLADSRGDVLSRAQALADEVAPQAGHFDREEALPREVIQRMADEGFLGAMVPQAFGGLGLDPLEYGDLTEIIGKACSSTRALLTVHASLVAETLAKRGSDELKAKYLPDLASGRKLACFALSEPQVGSDASSVRTTYRREGDSYVINGRKKWISFAGIADLFLVIASDEGAVTAFIVERSMGGVSTHPMTGLLGSRAAHIAEVEFRNVVVPAENVVSRVGVGFSFVANTALYYGRYSIAWAGVAVAQAALELMCTYATTREQFGQRIGSYQLVQGMVADSVVKVNAARELCRRAGRLRQANNMDAVMETNVAKYFASTVARDVTDAAVQVLGGNGCWNEYPAERLFREAKVLEIIEGTSQMQQIMIANHGFKKFGRRTRG